MKHRLSWPASLIVVLTMLARVQAGGGPENVAVVVNADSWASLAVANQYVALRRIPECNVIYLNGLPGNLSIDVEQFRELILKPVLQTLDQRGLSAQIDCIAYSADLPYSVHVQGDVGEHKLHRVLTPEASINGLTYLYSLVLAKDAPGYLSLTSNRYFRRLIGAPEDLAWTPDRRQRLGQASRLMHDKKWAEAESLLRKLAESHPNSSQVQYELACCLARQGKNDPAMAALQKAVDVGWLDVWHAQKDEDLASLRGRPEFAKLMEKIRATTFDTQAPRAFCGATAWSSAGEPTSPSTGTRYLLSTMLAMTSGRGNSVREAIEGLRRSASADGTRPKGTIYYLQNGDIRSTTRQWGFLSAAKRLKQLGVAAEVLQGVLPQKKADVAGAMIGIAGFDWKSSVSTILPGAVCEHLTSCGGIMHESGGQTPISEFLRYGAAGSSGTVTEPYAIQNKFPTAFLHVYYASGCTLAESFYQSVQGPYQLLIVGDPLCRPWAVVPQVQIEGAPGTAIKGPFMLRTVTRGEVKVGRRDLYLDGRRIARLAPGEEIRVDGGLLCDGYHEIRVSVAAHDPIESQGSATAPIVVDNHGLSLQADAPPKGARLDQSVKLRAKMAQAKRILWLQNWREVAAADGPEATVSIPAAKLGLGKVRLQSVALTGDAKSLPAAGLPPCAPHGSPSGQKPSSPPSAAQICLGRPIEMEILPALPLAAIKPPPAGLVRGLRLSRPGQPATVIEQTRPRDWLAKATQPGQEFVLEGYFDTPTEDMYQFQVRASMDAQLAVDGQILGQAGRELRYFPVSLASGLHRLTVKGRTAANCVLELYFGGPGATSLSAERFRCDRP